MFWFNCIEDCFFLKKNWSRCVRKIWFLSAGERAVTQTQDSLDLPIQAGTGGPEKPQHVGLGSDTLTFSASMRRLGQSSQEDKERGWDWAKHMQFLFLTYQSGFTPYSQGGVTEGPWRNQRHSFNEEPTTQGGDFSQQILPFRRNSTSMSWCYGLWIH